MVVRISEMNGLPGYYWISLKFVTGEAVTLSLPQKLLKALVQECEKLGVKVEFTDLPIGVK